MPGMSKKKPQRPRKPTARKEQDVEAVQDPETEAIPVRKTLSTPFRPDDPRLLDVLDVYAQRIRRSRNMAMNLLLEAAMEREGLWPPPADPSP
jgi:hypothetical protein